MARSKKGYQTYVKDECPYCEGTKFHWGKECGACEGTGSKKVKVQLDKVYRAKNGLPINERKK